MHTDAHIQSRNMSREYTPVFTRTTRLYKRDTYKKTHTYDPGPHLVSTPVIQMYFTPVHTRAHLYSCGLYTYKRPKKKRDPHNDAHILCRSMSCEYTQNAHIDLYVLYIYINQTTTHTYYLGAYLVSIHIDLHVLTPIQTRHMHTDAHILPNYTRPTRKTQIC